MAPHEQERGQAAPLLLGTIAALLAGALFLFALASAFGAKSRAQRAADLAAVSAARKMARLYPRLFEPPVIDGVPNPHYVSPLRYRALAIATALRAAAANGARHGVAVRFPPGPAPMRVAVRVRDVAHVKTAPHRRSRVRVEGRAAAEISIAAGYPGMPSRAVGSGYHGPLAYRQGKPMRPDVARAFDRLAAAARRGVHLYLVVTSGYRSDAEQARLFAAHPDPRWVARPGHSLHRNATELDLGPPAAYGWLERNASRFGFVKRYRWEPWHYGYVHNAGSASLGYGRAAGEGRSGVPLFVPAAFRAPIARAAQRWNVGGALLAAQLYVESGFDPLARSPAGALGIAQFMPGTATAYGLSDPLDARAAIDAQARLMRDHLRRFGSVPLALAAYNAGAGAVARCMCIPPYRETRGYVARILGMLGGVGDIAAPLFEVRLVA